MIVQLQLQNQGLKLMYLFNNLQQQYEQLWKYVIRPTRSTYPDKNLGPQTFELQGKKVKRVDFQLINPRGYLIFCSHFIPLEQEKYPCVVYMHGNSSNRTEGMEYIGHLIRNNISLCTFDFSGCGNSEGDYVSLGFYEQDDLNQVVEYIRHRPQITSIAIWGRSMGAVTGLLYMRKSNHVCAAIFDSPFKSLKSLIEDLCKKNSKIPALIIAGALKIIAGTIQEKAKFDVYKLNPLKYEVPFLKYPAFFIVGMQDDMIPPQHTIQLHEKYLGQNKYLQQVKGNHNDSRPEECIEKVLSFLVQNLNIDFHEKESPKPVLKKVQKQVEQFDFFQDKNQMDNSSKQNQDIDFFADDDTETQKQTNSVQFQQFSLQVQSHSVKKASDKNNQVFSLTSMLSNVFSTVQTNKDHTIKRGIDGYQKTIQRISRQMYIEETVSNKKAKIRAEKYQQKLQKQIKDCKNQTFEKQIVANLQSWAF